MNIQKRCLLHVSGFNLDLLMRVKNGQDAGGWARAWFALYRAKSDVLTALLVIVLIEEDNCSMILPLAMFRALL